MTMSSVRQLRARPLPRADAVRENEILARRGGRAGRVAGHAENVDLPVTKPCHRRWQSMAGIRLRPVGELAAISATALPPRRRDIGGFAPFPTFAPLPRVRLQVLGRPDDGAPH